MNIESTPQKQTKEQQVSALITRIKHELDKPLSETHKDLIIDNGIVVLSALVGKEKSRQLMDQITKDYSERREDEVLRNVRIRKQKKSGVLFRLNLKPPFGHGNKYLK